MLFLPRLLHFMQAGISVSYTHLDVYKRQVLNNAPSLGELEAKAKAGAQISLTDLAAAVKAEEKAPKAKKSRTAKPKKPSIRAQLDAAKKEQSKQTPPREKTNELEV